MIQTVLASWETPYTDDVWEVLQQKKTDERTQKDIDVLSFGPALPDEEEGRVALLTVHVHRENEKEQAEAPRELHWTLVVSPPPSDEVPEKVRTIDRNLEGRRGLLTLIERCIVGVPPVALFRLTMNIPGSEYRCKVLPKEISRGGEHDIAASLSRTSRMEQVGYRFEDSPYGLEEMAIIYDHEDDAVIVNTRARGILKLGSRTWLPYAEEVADIVLKAFFSRGGVG
ncbi:MAG: hypothetical protein IT372_34335 [Polyangiaceae bacterium]|nr:hypothetical protein [Polyangiaceae bacterium]